MRITIDINEELMQEALRISKFITKKEVIEAALKEYIHFLHRQELLSLSGKIDWDGPSKAI